MGGFKKDKMHGDGAWKLASGDSGKGQFFDNKMNGIGHYIYADGVRQYKGELSAGKMHGYCVLTQSNGNTFSKITRHIRTASVIAICQCQFVLMLQCQ